MSMSMGEGKLMSAVWVEAVLLIQQVDMFKGTREAATTVGEHEP